LIIELPAQNFLALPADALRSRVRPAILQFILIEATDDDIAAVKTLANSLGSKISVDFFFAISLCVTLVPRPRAVVSSFFS
jgi:hypothetical protein